MNFIKIMLQNSNATNNDDEDINQICLIKIKTYYFFEISGC